MAENRPPKGALNEEEYFRESQQLYTALLSEPPRKGWWGALVIALLVHGVIFALHFDTSPPPMPEKAKKRVVKITRPSIPPPPKMKKPKEVVKKEKKKKKLPIPDPDPDEPEPIVEPEPPDEPDLDLDLDFEFEEVVGIGSGGFTAAKVAYSVNPTFPTAALQAGIREAKVKVLLTVGPTGKVTDVTWLEGMKTYQPPVKAAMMQWTFEPAMQDGKAVEYTWAQTFIFRLE